MPFMDWVHVWSHRTPPRRYNGRNTVKEIRPLYLSTV